MAKPSDANIELVSFSRIAEAFAIKMKASACKMTSPNPRVEILQQGFDASTGIVTTHIPRSLSLRVSPVQVTHTLSQEPNNANYHPFQA